MYHFCVAISCPIKLADTTLTAGPFLSDLRHLTIGSPSNAIPLQRGRNLTSLTFSKAMSTRRLQLLIDGLTVPHDIKYLGITGGTHVSAFTILSSIIPAINVEVIAISTGLPESEVSLSIFIGRR